jgi:glutamine synthetase adenylyltransferase
MYLDSFGTLYLNLLYNANVSEEHHQNTMNNVLPLFKDITTAVMYAAEARDVESVLERIAQVSQQLVNARYVASAYPMTWAA